VKWVSLLRSRRYVILVLSNQKQSKIRYLGSNEESFALPVLGSLWQAPSLSVKGLGSIKAQFWRVAPSHRMLILLMTGICRT
jgi:hypothetical protein